MRTRGKGTVADSVPETDSGTTGITPDGHGVLKSITSSRNMRSYIVTAFELHGLSSMNDSCTFCVGMATTFGGIGIGILVSAAFADPKAISPEGRILAGLGVWIFLGMALIFIIAAIVNYCRVKGAIGRIKLESQN